MIIIRPIALKDLDALYALAKKAGKGLTTLPADRRSLKIRIEESIAAFTVDNNTTNELSYLMVAENTETKAIIGTSGIFPAVGLSKPFYNYKLLKTVSVSKDPPIKVDTQVLILSNEYTGATELATLFLDPDYRVSGIGKLLSKCRFLLIAAYPNRFSELVMAEIRGWVDENGKSPFWEAVGRHFFGMEFAEADTINSRGNNQFIGDLMPKFPIYSNLLPENTRAVIGRPHVNSATAMKILEKEGFRYRGSVDIFDAGPCLDADRDNIRSVRKTKSAVITAIEDKIEGGEHVILANPFIEAFCAAHGDVIITGNADNRITISREVADAMGVDLGMEILYLRPPAGQYDD